MNTKVGNEWLQLGVPSSVCLSLAAHYATTKKISKLEIPPAVHKWSQKWLSLLPVQKTSTSMWCFTSWVCLGISRWQRMSSNFHDLAAHFRSTLSFPFDRMWILLKDLFETTGGSEIAKGKIIIVFFFFFLSSRQKMTECHSLIYCKKLRQITGFIMLFSPPVVHVLPRAFQRQNAAFLVSNSTTS